MRRMLVVVTYAALALGPVGAAPLVAGVGSPTDAAHDCRGTVPCPMPSGCSVVTAACAASVLTSDPYTFGAPPADQEKAPAVGLSLHTQRTPAVRTPPPRS